jgi:hypothetical protein
VARILLLRMDTHNTGNPMNRSYLKLYLGPLALCFVILFSSHALTTMSERLTYIIEYREKMPKEFINPQTEHGLALTRSGETDQNGSN